MENSTTSLSTVTIGIDHGDRHSHPCLLDDGGTVVEEGRLATTPDAFRRRFAGLPRARIALEVGTHSPWISALLAELGHAVHPLHDSAGRRETAQQRRRLEDHRRRPARPQVPQLVLQALVAALTAPLAPLARRSASWFMSVAGQ